MGLHVWKQAMPKLLKHRFMLVLLNASLALVFLGSAQAQDLGDTVQTESRINQDAVTSQQRVTGLAQQTQDLLARKGGHGPGQ